MHPNAAAPCLHLPAAELSPWSQAELCSDGLPLPHLQSKAGQCLGAQQAQGAPELFQPRVTLRQGSSG